MLQIRHTNMGWFVYRNGKPINPVAFGTYHQALRFVAMKKAERPKVSRTFI